MTPLQETVQRLKLIRSFGDETPIKPTQTADYGVKKLTKSNQKSNGEEADRGSRSADKVHSSIAQLTRDSLNAVKLKRSGSPMNEDAAGLVRVNDSDHTKTGHPGKAPKERSTLLREFRAADLTEEATRRELGKLMLRYVHGGE